MFKKLRKDKKESVAKDKNTQSKISPISGPVAPLSEKTCENLAFAAALDLGFADM